MRRLEPAERVIVLDILGMTIIITRLWFLRVSYGGGNARTKVCIWALGNIIILIWESATNLSFPLTNLPTGRTYRWGCSWARPPRTWNTMGWILAVLLGPQDRHRRKFLYLTVQWPRPASSILKCPYIYGSHFAKRYQYNNGFVWACLQACSVTMARN